MREARGVKKRQRAVADVHVGRKWISFARQTREKILFLSTYSAVGTSLSARRKPIKIQRLWTDALHLFHHGETAAPAADLKRRYLII